MSDRLPKGLARAQIEALAMMTGKDPSAITGAMEGGYKPRKPRKPRDDAEKYDQIAVLHWAHNAGWPYNRLRSYPAEAVFKMLPRGGRSEASRAARVMETLKAMGLLVGHPDLILPVPVGGFGSLYIELKRTELRSGGVIVRPKGRVSKAQESEIEMLRADGNAVAVCYGHDMAIRAMRQYAATAGRLALPISSG